VSLARGTHSCYTTAAGKLKCWGENADGELGNGTTVPGAFPGEVPGVTDAATVAVAGGTTCAVTRGGEVRCWGKMPGESNQGPGRKLKSGAILPGLAGVARVALSDGGGTCALLRDGHVSCFQRDPAATSLSVTGRPALVEGLDDVIDLAAGRDFCALRRGGSVVCWPHADDDDGRMPLTPVPGLGDVVQIAPWLFGNRWCAVLRGGSVACWGEGYRSVGAPGPVTVAGVAGARSVSLGSGFGCAQLDQGEIWCWTDQPGPRSQPPRTLSRPSVLAGVAPGTQLWGGAGHACLEGPDHAVRCLPDSWSSSLLWGANREDFASLQAVAPADLAVPSLAPVAGLPGCQGAAPRWRCHYVWDGKALRAAAMVAPAAGVEVRTFEGPGSATVQVGSQTFVVAISSYMVRRELAVSEVIGGESFLRGHLTPGNPEPKQPDGNRYLLVSYRYALWVEGNRIHLVASKVLLNPP
jgi:hypothetical protein